MSLVKTIESFFAEFISAQEQGSSSSGAQPLVAAVSGGPDSVALLHALARQGAFPADKLVVAHLNHQLRPESAADASFVRALAEEWQIEFCGGETDVVELSQSRGLSLEAAARDARYSFLAEVAREVGATAVVTGHNQNDQAETVLMHILRGSGLTGLRGMRPVSPLPGAPELDLLRPLLGVDRATIEAYCLRNDLTFVQDDSNLDTTFFRNRLRHELLPELVSYNPRIVALLYNLATVVDAEETLLTQLTTDIWPEIVEDVSQGRISLDLARWRSLPLALKRRTLRYAVSLLKPELAETGFEATELARQVAETGQTGDQATLPGRLTLLVSYGQLIITIPDDKATPAGSPQLAGESEVPLSVPGRLELPGGWVINVERVEGVPFELIVTNPDPWQAYIKADYAGELCVRPRRTGERFQPFGLGGQSAKIGDVMTNRKIPAGLRALWPVVSGADHLLWLAGHSLDERASIDPSSDQALLLQLERC